MPVKLKPTDEDYLPQVERRFLFDDAAVQEHQQAHKSGSGPTTAKELFKTDQVFVHESQSACCALIGSENCQQQSAELNKP